MKKTGVVAVLSHLFEMVEGHCYWVTYVWVKNAIFERVVVKTKYEIQLQRISIHNYVMTLKFYTAYAKFYTAYAKFYSKS